MKNYRMLLSVAVLLAIGAAAIFFTSASQSQQSPQPPVAPPVPVRTVQAEQHDMPHMVDVVGTVESMQSIVVRTQVDGVLTDISFNEGDLVKKDQQLAQIDDRALSAALAAAEAELARDRALLRAAELDLKRYETLLKREAGSRQQVDQQTAEVDQLRATVRLDQANVETARVTLSYTRILAPVTGRVGIRRVDAGNIVRTTDAEGIVSVVEIDPISVVFPVPQRLLADLRSSSQEANGATVEAIDRDTGAVLGQGRIVAFDNAIDTGTGTLRVRARFDNREERLSPGAFLSVRVRTGLTPGAVVLPTVAVRPGVDGHFVFRVRDNMAERVPVELGYANEDLAVITSGIAAGDHIVVDGYSRLTSGAKVDVQGPATPTPAVASSGEAGTS